MKYLIVPGLYNSGPQHWQTIWEQSDRSSFTRVQQSDWNFPDKDTWTSTLNKHVEQMDGAAIVVAHSLGCITAVHWMNEYHSPLIEGLLLVAPADVEASARTHFNSFAPVPLSKLKVPSVVVASMNDQYCAIHRAARWAAYWQSRFVCVGNKGHINSDSQLGEWTEGLELLTGLGESVMNKNYRFAI